MNIEDKYREKVNLIRSNRSKACDIKPVVRAVVKERDGHHCINCGISSHLQLAHVFVNRSHGGLGVAQNLVTLCIGCHMSLDNGRYDKSKPVRELCESYLKRMYPSFDFDTLKYKKGE